MTKASKVFLSSASSVIFGSGVYASSLSRIGISPLNDSVNISEALSKLQNSVTHERGEIEQADNELPEEVGELSDDWKEDAEIFKEEDPDLYKYLLGKSHKKEVVLEEAKQKLNVLMDHTLLISYAGGCPIGTGWILDYVLPKDGKSYPTKFFVASNAHVANKFKWDASNPYDQELSDYTKDIDKSWKGNECAENPGEIMLVKEKINHDKSQDFDKDVWKHSHKKYEGKEMWVPDEGFDVSKHEASSDVDAKYWQFKFKDPKLVYFPYEYLSEEKKNNIESSYKDKYDVADFVVFEVDFKNENVAKLFTRDFYGKYDRDKGTLTKQALNFFAKPLHERYKSGGLLEEDTQVWIAGYPENGMFHKASSNYNLKQKSASRFVYNTFSFTNEEGRYLLGYCEDGYKWTWKGKEYELGGFYCYDNPLLAGSSGSLAIDDNNNVLGLHSGRSGIYGLTTPIRNIELKNQAGKIIVPEYDLIEGVAGQNGSYKEQIQKYFLKYGQQTNLSKHRNWEAIRS